jgi:hypothetical protein
LQAAEESRDDETDDGVGIGVLLLADHRLGCSGGDATTTPLRSWL